MGTLAVWACVGSPYPGWLLGRPRLVLDAPAGWLRQEIDRLPLKTRFKAAPTAARQNLFQQTAEADLAEVTKALFASGMPLERREPLFAQYFQVRDRLRGHAASMGAFREPGAPVRPPIDGETLEVVPVPADLRVPAGLPGEIADYLEGAVAYHRERFPEARAAWEHLLARPVAERRLRSTWAAFMLGKLALRTGGQGAVRRFHQTRDLAAHGFADSLGLAAASLGWEARVQLRLGHPEAALPLYARQLRSGDALALSSIQFVCRQALKDGPKALAPIARSTEARRVFTAFLLWRHPAPWAEDNGDDGPLRTEPPPDAGVAVWLEEIREAGVKKAAEAGRLAWAAYQGGDFEAARSWLELAPENEAMARWIRAKLLLRDGKLAEAEPLLSQAAGEVTAPRLFSKEYFQEEPHGRMATGPLASGEAGVVRTDLGRYPQALDAFLRGGFWLDAAYLAEQVMTADELKAYVDATWPARLATGEEHASFVEGYETPGRGRIATPLRYLLGRRLVRLGRSREARKYLPAEQRRGLAALTGALREGRDAALPRAGRAKALFRAACLSRKEGLELLGTELGPDWLTYGSGREMLYPTPFALRKGGGLQPAPDEEARQRWGTAEVVPQKRFHYKYRATDLAWEAARLLPNDSDRKAEILATAGTWLKYQDPQAADRFYKALARTRTDLGRQADKMRWIPKTAACDPAAPEGSGG
jgi:hypothetical protein